jgi:hypothetical protein
MSYHYEPDQPFAMFKNPLAEYETEQKKKADREELERKREAERKVSSAEQPTWADIEAEQQAQAIARSKAALQREKETFERKEREKREATLAARTAPAEDYEKIRQAEIARNNSWIPCPRCLGTFKKTVDGKLPEHMRRIPSQELGVETVECKPSSAPFLDYPAVK